MSQLYEVPSLIAAVEVNHHRGHEDGKEVNHREHLQLVGPREDAQVTEQEERHQSDEGQVERREQHAHDASSQDDFFLSFHLID